MEPSDAAEKRFLFHGNAVALAAHIRRPCNRFVNAVCSSCLPVTGGRAEASKCRRRYSILSFQSAATSALGDYIDPERAVKYTNGNYGSNELPTLTITESKLTGFKIEVPRQKSAPARTFQAKHLHTIMGSTSNRKSENAFPSLFAAIDGVSIDGKPLQVNTDPELFTQCCTKERLHLALEDPVLRERYSKHIFSYSSAPNTSDQNSGRKSILPGTIVSSLCWPDGEPPDTKIHGNHHLEIVGLGSIYFGEIFIQEGFRRLTLLRFQLGSPYGGEGAVCEVQSNGQTMPP